MAIFSPRILFRVFRVRIRSTCFQLYLGSKRVVFSVNLRLVEYIPDYYDPNNSQVASRATINSLELNVMSDLYYVTATLRKNNIVMSQ